MVGITKKLTDYTFDEIRPYMTGRAASIMDSCKRDNRELHFMYAIKRCFVDVVSTDAIQLLLERDDNDFWRAISEYERGRERCHMRW